LTRLRLVCPRLASPQVVKRYRIPLPNSLILGGFETSKTAEAEISVTWDERYTTVHYAAFYATLHGRNDGWPFAPRAFEARFFMNENLIASRGWGAEPSCRTQEIETGVLAYLLNGWNKFKLEVVASWGPLPVGPDAITAGLEVEFTGREPRVQLPPPWWWPYVKWGLVGVGAIAGLAFVVPKAIELVRKS